MLLHSHKPPSPRTRSLPHAPRAPSHLRHQSLPIPPLTPPPEEAPPITTTTTTNLPPPPRDLARIQHLLTTYESLKPQLRATRHEMQRCHAQLNFWTREIHDCQKRLRGCCSSTTPTITTIAATQARSNKHQQQQNYDHDLLLLAQLQESCDRAKLAYQAQKDEYEQGEAVLAGLRDEIHGLMRVLSLRIASAFSTSL